MIGDFIIWFRKAWKENFCIHDYERKHENLGLGYKFYKECRKCGRLK
jgi:hypothetical protein